MKKPLISAIPAQLGRRLASAALACSLVFGTIAVTVTSASAASFVSGCFRSNQGLDLWDTSVQLEVYFEGY